MKTILNGLCNLFRPAANQSEPVVLELRSSIHFGQQAIQQEQWATAFLKRSRSLSKTEKTVSAEQTNSPFPSAQTPHSDKTKADFLKPLNGHL